MADALLGKICATSVRRVSSRVSPRSGCSTRFQLLCVKRGWVVGDELTVDEIREPAFEAADCFAACLSFSALLVEVGNGAGFVVQLEREGVERPVESPVAASGQSVPGGPA